MTLLFEKNGTTILLNKLGSNRFRLSLQKNTAQGASEELTASEVSELIVAMSEAYRAEPPPESEASKRMQAVGKALKAYAEESSSTIEKLDKEIASTQVYDKAIGKKRAMTREEWLSELLGAEELEEVLAGKVSLKEALADLEEVTLSDEDEDADDGDSLRA